MLDRVVLLLGRKSTQREKSWAAVAAVIFAAVVVIVASAGIALDVFVGTVGRSSDNIICGYGEAVVGLLALDEASLVRIGRRCRSPRSIASC